MYRLSMCSLAASTWCSVAPKAAPAISLALFRLPETLSIMSCFCFFKSLNACRILSAGEAGEEEGREDAAGGVGGVDAAAEADIEDTRKG